MTVLERVEELLKNISPDPLCDDCIAKRLELSVRQHANQKSRQLAGKGGFVRQRDTCTGCSSEKTVIRYA